MSPFRLCLIIEQMGSTENLTKIPNWKRAIVMCSCLLIEVLFVFKNGKFQSNICNGFGTKYLTKKWRRGE